MSYFSRVFFSSVSPPHTLYTRLTSQTMQELLPLLHPPLSATRLSRNKWKMERKYSRKTKIYNLIYMWIGVGELLKRQKFYFKNDRMLFFYKSSWEWFFFMKVKFWIRKYLVLVQLKLNKNRFLIEKKKWCVYHTTSRFRK